MAFLRPVFMFLSLFFMTAFMMSLPVGTLGSKILFGLGMGAALSALFFGLETLFKRYSLKAFNTIILGLFLGTFIGYALVTVFYGVVDLTHMAITLQPQTLDLLKVSLYLMGIYLGTVLTLHFSNQFHLSIPFVKFEVSQSSKKDLLIEASALNDSRILDLASTGLLDNLLIMPRFLLKELQTKAELADETEKNKAKQALETFKKLVATEDISVRFDETQFTGYEDSFHKVVRLARQMEANILTGDHSCVQVPPVEGIKIINLHALSNALKPLNQAGEVMKIKIQRFGKEPNQGVGYLDDGTMVVVNGGGDYIGECIPVQVLSVKHTSSGRMIFCNTQDDAVGAKGNQVEA